MNISILEPKVVNSHISTNALIEPFCRVIDSEIGDKNILYKGSIIDKSILKENVFVSDYSKIDNSTLENYSRVGKLNHLYFVSLGKHTYTGQDTVIMHSEIGAFTSISWGVTIGAGEHDYKRITSHCFLYNSYDQLNKGASYYNRFEKQCKIGNDVWIGANSTILRGIEVSDGAIIGANSVVTKSVPPYAIVAGNPAKIIKYRFDDEIIKILCEIKWWNLDDKIIRDNCELFSLVPNISILHNIKDIITNKGRL